MAQRRQRPIGIDLFSGAGGLSLGFEQAGFDVLAAVEVDPVHAATHEYNFPECKVFPVSAAGITGDEIRKRSEIGSQSVDVVFGGPPCQGFSMIGKRSLSDERNSLVGDFIRLVSELDADYFLFENVKGLTIGKHRVFLEELIEQFDARGYEATLPWQVLNAANFGVPQSRERFFLLGCKKGMASPQYPDPICVPAGQALDLLLPVGPTCGEALGDLPDPEALEQLEKTDEVMIASWETPSPYATALRQTESVYFEYARKWEPKLLTSSARTNHSDISRRRFQQTAPGSVEPISRFFKLPPNGVSNTLRAGTDGSRGAFTSPRPIHYRDPRCITVREMARLHGFPDWFRFHRTKWNGARQVGNAVPPPLGRFLAGEILMQASPATEKA